MAQFQFSLQTALDLRSREENEAHRRLAAARRRVRRRRADLDQTRERHDDLLRSLRGEGEGASGTVALARIEHEHRFIAQLRRKLDRQRRRVEEAASELERRRVALIAASRARRTLERLSERRRAEHRREQKLSEQRELNEAAISRHRMNERSPGLLAGPANES